MIDDKIGEAIALALQQMSWIEVGAVITGIIYVVLAARENIWCWSFGIVSSILSIYLFITVKLYAEAFLYFYYVLAGIYGWWEWGRTNGKEALQIGYQRPGYHIGFVLVGVALAFGLAQILAYYSDAQQPLIDAHTTIFSFIATYLATRKLLENWMYWIVIDAVSVWLYWDRTLYLYSLLMVAYTVIAAWGLWNWWQRMNKETTSF